MAQLTISYCLPLIPMRTDKRIDDQYINGEEEEQEPKGAELDYYMQDSKEIKIKQRDDIEELLDLYTPLSKLNEQPQLVKRMSILKSFKQKRTSASKDDESSIGGKSTKNLPKMVIDSFQQNNYPKALEKVQNQEGDEIDDLRRRILKEHEIKAKILKDKLKKRAQQGTSQNMYEEGQDGGLVFSNKPNINTMRSNIKVERLPKLIPQPLIAKIQEGVERQKKKQNSSLLKIKKNNDQIVDPYMMDDAKSFFKNQEYQFLTGDDCTQGAIKDLIQLESGVTFVELHKSYKDNQGNSSMQDTTKQTTKSQQKQDYRPGATFVKQGPSYEEKYKDHKMTLSQYKSMQGFAQFGTSKDTNNNNNNSLNKTQMSKSINNLNTQNNMISKKVANENFQNDYYNNLEHDDMRQTTRKSAQRERSAIIVHSRDSKSVLNLSMPTRNIQQLNRNATNNSSLDMVSSRPSTSMMDHINSGVQYGRSLRKMIPQLNTRNESGIMTSATMIASNANLLYPLLTQTNNRIPTKVTDYISDRNGSVSNNNPNDTATVFDYFNRDLVTGQSHGNRAYGVFSRNSQNRNNVNALLQRSERQLKSQSQKSRQRAV